MNSPEQSKYPAKQYVWALGDGVREVPLGQQVDSRYRVVSPCIWLDTQANQPPQVPDAIPAFAQPYLKAHPHRLHVPGAYGICHHQGEPVLLLDNIPVSRSGKLLPSLTQAWPHTTAFRQVYWFWQTLKLWTPLAELGVAASLLNDHNLRVEGWRVRLVAFTSEPAQPGLGDLAEFWSQLGLSSDLQAICDQLRAETVNLDEVFEALNRQLLTQAMAFSLSLEIAGATSAGPQQPRNEDACYPSRAEFKRTSTADLPSLPRLGIVCDGVGGHAGGEVASQTVVRSLQLQLRALLAEAAEQTEPMPPELVIEQIEAAIRVANNLVASQNDSQGRLQRQRMGTTLVVALQLPQRIPVPGGWEEVNELYIAHVGDSRAYWITPEYCHQLTLDDDIAGREVASGRSLLAAAQQRPDADALTQAVGTREADYLKPHIQRFILDEEGVLLLCSDGLSDHRRVEESWANYIGLIVTKIVSVSSAVESWIELANQKNGHDNVAVVLTHCQVSGPTARPVETGRLITQQDIPQTELTEASKALLYGEVEDDLAEAAASDEGLSVRSRAPWLKAVLALISLVVLAAAGFYVWRAWQLRPSEGLPPIEAPDS
ncbi:MAG: serine/threonine protein phosphatase [Leptolyngbya sp. SIO4C1]|nr:serine/threonine protein phosphatase [Leptolyngbya sp. SIO4C1]